MWYVVTNSDNHDNVTKYEYDENNSEKNKSSENKSDENKSDENKSDENKSDEYKSKKNKSCEQRTFADPSYFTTGKTTSILRRIISIISTN